MSDKVNSLQRGVEYGLANGKKNMIVDLDVLRELFEQRDKLMYMVRCVSVSLSQTSGQVPPIVTIGLAEKCNKINQELNLL